MKRIIAVVLSAVLALCAFVPAFADMDGPSFANFDVIVTNPLGTYMYNYNMDEVKGYLIKDTVVTINGEYEFEDEEYYSIEYNENHGYIKVADTALTEETFPPERGVKLEKETKSIVISDGLYMHKGPSEKFEKVGEKIAVGTVLTYQYVDNGFNPPWAYVTYKGVSGWVYVYEYGESYYCATPFEEDTEYTGSLYVVLEGVRLTDMPENPEYEQWREEADRTGVKYVTKEIPVGTKLELADYYYKNAKSIWVYTEYNGVKGWLETDTYYNGAMYNATATGMSGAYYVWQEDGLPVYSKAGDTSSEIIGKLEKGTFVETNYIAINEKVIQEDEDYTDGIDVETIWEYASWYGVEIDGKQGWIFINHNTDDKSAVSAGDIRLNKTKNKEINLRKEVAKDSEAIAVIPAGSDIITLGYGDECILVDYEGKLGFIPEDSIVEKDWEEYEADNYSADDYFAGRKAEETTLPETTAQPTTQAVSETQTEAETETTEKAEANGFTPAQIAIFCGAGAVILALTAAVTIILINKKKKA